MCDAQIPAHTKDISCQSHIPCIYIYIYVYMRFISRRTSVLQATCLNTCSYLRRKAKPPNVLVGQLSVHIRCILREAPAGTVKLLSVWAQLPHPVLPLAAQLGNHASQAASCFDRCVSTLLPRAETKAAQIMSSSQENLKEIH